MPELPEVETIKNDLSQKILDKTITAAEARTPRLVKSGAKKFKEVLTGNQFKKINRRGKLIYMELKSGDFLLIHLKMTGQLIYQQGEKIIGGGHGELAEEKLPGRHTHVILSFRDGSHLYFNDLRQFGYMRIVSQIELEKELKKFGIEPLTAGFTLQNFVKIFADKKTTVKALLLNQKLIAGIGNIYADESCFWAKIKPTRKIASLTESEIKCLYSSIKKVLKLAIKKRGTTFNNYRDADGQKGGFIKFLKVYARKGERCKRCRRGIIIKIKQGGRGTHFCPICQR